VNVSRPYKPVLVVEDDPSIREVLTTLLESDGYTVECASNGREALALIQEDVEPCLILLDYNMPVMDGRTFRLRQLQNGIHPRVPVVLYSADDSVKIDDLHVDAVLGKPIDFVQLLKLVEQACVPTS
jgi:CheY-like chemotaxis protein